MAIYSHFRMPVYPLFTSMAEALQDARPALADHDREANNLTIIICRACLVEGILEEETHRVLRFYAAKYQKVSIPVFETRKPMNLFVNRMMEDLESRVARTTGIDNYAALINTLLGGSLLSAPGLASCVEGLKVLFQLRNVIAHGRAVRATVRWRGDSPADGGEDFRGGYSLAERYLLKNGLIDQRFYSAESASWIFSDNVADHFTRVAEEFTGALTKYIDAALADLEKSSLTFPLIG